ncbi:DMT family transporter [Inquilinus limosus]|uniref:DMT family transporter n=1 Tax=Inquilinus limosus TaxID=171674 RepID=UPI0004072301|nr:DMT family transporter [Inquilinus limosus]
MATNAASRAPGVSVQGLGFLVATSLMWGFNWPLVKHLVTVLPPFSVRAASGLIGTAIVLAIALARRESLRPPRGQWGRLCLAAGLNVTAWMALTTLSLLWLRASETTILAYTLPLWAALLAWPLLGEKPTLARGIGLVLGLSGIVLLVAHEAPGDAEIGAKLPGVALALAGSMLFALGTVLAKRAPVAMPPTALVAWQTGLGLLPLLLFWLLFEQPDFAALDGFGWLALVYGGALAFGLAYVAWFAALRRLPALVATIGSLMAPVIGVLASVAMLGDPFGLREIAALALTLGGVALAALAR